MGLQRHQCNNTNNEGNVNGAAGQGAVLEIFFDFCDNSSTQRFWRQNHLFTLDRLRSLGKHLYSVYYTENYL